MQDIYKLIEAQQATINKLSLEVIKLVYSKISSFKTSNFFFKSFRKNQTTYRKKFLKKQLMI